MAAGATSGSFSPLSAPPSLTRRRSTLTVRCSMASGVAAASALILDDLRLKCATPLPVLRRVADAMTADMRAGLAAEGGGELKMLLSYVDSLPTGNEKGHFYALDLGGTNFRVLRVELGGKEGRVVNTEFEKMSIPQELMSGTTEELFDFIASGLAGLVAKEEKSAVLGGKKRELGFTFSFPVKQTSIKSGILIKWTKGFSVTGTAGRDVVACLNEAMKRQRLDMHVSALVNDAVGTLAGARYWDDDVMVAVILGTGTNACYIECVDAIPKLHKGVLTGSRSTIINTEWGAFSNGLPLTEFDKDMDNESINPGEQIFEKTVSGMYLGEIVRRVLQKLAKDCTLFGDLVPNKLSVPFSLRTQNLSDMQLDESKDLQLVGSILGEFVDVRSSSLIARKIAVDVCDIIVKRGARLAGAGIVGILQKMEQDSKGNISRKRTVVAMDGGLYEHYRHYRRYLEAAVEELLGPEASKNVFVEHSKDGSGIGAALLAAANSKCSSHL